jgi:hydrogenase-1 operon protein HyaF
MNSFDIPLGAVGRGSQPTEADGAELAYLPLPSEMAVYRPVSLPERAEVAGLGAGLDKLSRLLGLLRCHRIGEPGEVLDLSDLDPANRDLVAQTLGEGEVSVRYQGARHAQIQETRLAGVWHVRMTGENGGLGRDTLEVADLPALVRQRAFEEPPLPLPAAPPAGAGNGRAVLTELVDRSGAWRPGDEPHVVNLTLLPLDPADLALLREGLGTGPLTMLSRGYGNCRISATRQPRVWWVQHFNSEDVLILDTLVVTDVPAEALAAREDIEDSTARLAEILAALT